MVKEFLELNSLVLDVNGLKNGVELYRNQLRARVKLFNETFSLKNKHELKFDDEGTLMTPVPFGAPPLEHFKYALIGLNPKFDKGEGAKEKKQAGKTWDDQARYYNSWNVFKMAFQKNSSYYINRLKFLHTLNKGTLIQKKDILHYYKCDNFFDVFVKVMSDAPTIFAEFIPFHSQSFKTLNNKEIENGLNQIKGYKDYLLKLMDLIDKNLLKNGVIIFDGKNPSDVYKKILSDELTVLKTTTFSHNGSTKPAYEICKWHDRLVVFTGGTIYGSYTAVNGERVEQMSKDISHLQIN